METLEEISYQKTPFFIWRKRCKNHPIDLFQSYKIGKRYWNDKKVEKNDVYIGYWF
jgi:hypothetical protein